jgi:tRNA threonylcarbamoyladenosine modification (KEOPS) complex Cgi121 subunit
MLFETITWKDETVHACISEYKNPDHLDSAALLQLANNHSKKLLAVQFFDGSMIVDEMHLLCAIQNAYNALKGGYMKSRSLDVEIALYTSAQHQIGVALNLMGISDATKTLNVVALGENRLKVEECMNEIGKAIGSEVKPAFAMTKRRLSFLMNAFKISESELELFFDQDDVKSRQQALSKCIVSRISQVALSN